LGSIKNKTNDEQSHTLTETEFNVVMNLNVAKQTALEQMNRAISTYLKGVCSTRLGYTAEEDLQFELDFANEKHELKITRFPKK
jgi:hypothetical protein